MSDTITIELSEQELLNALNRLSPERRHRLLQQLADTEKPKLVSLPATKLDAWTAVISIGGDALEESEQIYDD